MNNKWTQLPLESERLVLLPLKKEDFASLYDIGSDPLLWEQHPNKNRYELVEFRNFFKGALESNGAYKIMDNQHHVVGCSRYYDYDANDNSIFVGYTFIGRAFWGKGLNQELKHLMINHAFKEVDIVRFHIGETNFRSQKSIERFGAVKTGEIAIAYYREPTRQNFIYEITKTRQRFG